MRLNLRQFLDQSDYVDANARLTAEIDSLESKLRASGKDVPPRPQFTGDYIADNDKLADHRAVLTAADNRRLPVPTEQDSRYAPSRVVRDGIGKKASLTEQVLAAKGVSSLDELNAKRQSQRPQPGD